MPEVTRFRPPGAFIKHLLECCDVSRRRPPTSTEEWERWDLNLTKWKLGAGFFVPFIILKSLGRYEVVTEEHAQSAIAAVDDITRSVSDEFVVWIVGGQVQLSPEMRREIGLEYDIAIIDRPIIDNVYAADRPGPKQKAFAAGLVESLGRQRLSPFTPGDVAYGGRFFGRSSFVQRALSAHNSNGLTFVGNRRIGKTSLLKEIKHQLGQRNDRLRTVDLYGSTYHSTYEVVTKLLRELRPELAARIERGDQRLISDFPQLVHQLPDKENIPVAVFVDEVDDLLALDYMQEHELMTLLRAAFQHEGCRAFFAGFRRTIEAKQRNDTPLFNFTNQESVPPFTREETTAMITGPLMLLGLDVTSTDVPAMIYRESGGHPELIQIFCAELIARSEGPGRLPSDVDLLADVLASDIFRQKVLGAFLSNTNAREQLLCYALILQATSQHIELDQFDFGIKDIGGTFERHGLSISVPDLTGLAGNLKIAGVFEEVRRGMRYRFAVPQLGTYCRILDLPFCIRSAKELIEKHPSDGVWDEPRKLHS